MTKVFVGNFSFSVDDDQLRDYFNSAGTVVSAKVMKEGQGGRSRGFGFVEFAGAEDAQKAISELNGSVWEGRVIKVSEDRSHRRDSETSESTEGAQRSSAPTGYFRAQPLELGFRRRKKLDPFVEDPNSVVDYKDPKLLARFMSERGRILPRRMTGLTASNQRKVTKAIKRSQSLGLLPYQA
jgi:small subunit ribosomal protein S18